MVKIWANICQYLKGINNTAGGASFVSNTFTLILRFIALLRGQPIFKINEINQNKTKKMEQIKIYEGSINPSFLTPQFEVPIYWTPKQVADYIEREKIKSIISNPPYDIH